MARKDKGLTAAFAMVLGESGISTKVVAGYHHAHMCVSVDRANDARAAWERLGANT
jgi:hypothetical protein